MKGEFLKNYVLAINNIDEEAKSASITEIGETIERVSDGLNKMKKNQAYFDYLCGVLVALQGNSIKLIKNSMNKD